MALQDQPQNPPSMVDPATGLPFEIGTPEYTKAIAPWLTSQLHAQSQEAANARGGFYSGSAMADEIQAQQGALNALAQQGAMQSLQEKELAQQEAFQQQMQKEQNQANADIASKQGKAAATQGAVAGGTQALGTLGGMAAYSHFMHPGAPAAVAGLPGHAAGAATLQPYYDGMGNLVTPSGPAQAAGAAPGAAGYSNAAWGGGALGAIGGGYLGAQAGSRTFGGNTTGNQVASGLGGATGAALGSFGGPAGMAAGAALGSFIGPGVARGGEAVGNWLSQRFHI